MSASASKHFSHGSGAYRGVGALERDLTDFTVYALGRTAVQGPLHQRLRKGCPMLFFSSPCKLKLTEAYALVCLVIRCRACTHFAPVAIREVKGFHAKVPVAGIFVSTSAVHETASFDYSLRPRSQYPLLICAARVMRNFGQGLVPRPRPDLRRGCARLGEGTGAGFAQAVGRAVVR